MLPTLRNCSKSSILFLLPCIINSDLQKASFFSRKVIQHSVERVHGYGRKVEYTTSFSKQKAFLITYQKTNEFKICLKSGIENIQTIKDLAELLLIHSNSFAFSFSKVITECLLFLLFDTAKHQ